MKRNCLFCRTEAVSGFDQTSADVTGGVCESCSAKFRTSSDPRTLKRLVDALDAPLLVMQKEPRQVYTANRKALELFDKELEKVEKRRGGQVFDCLHAFTEAGCGRDAHCEPCRIKNAIVETLSTGRPCSGVSAVLDIKKGEGISFYTLQISTEKVGEMALVRIDRYESVT